MKKKKTVFQSPILIWSPPTIQNVSVFIKITKLNRRNKLMLTIENNDSLLVLLFQRNQRKMKVFGDKWLIMEHFIDRIFLRSFLLNNFLTIFLFLPVSFFLDFLLLFFISFWYSLFILCQLNSSFFLFFRIVSPSSKAINATKTQSVTGSEREIERL